MFPSTVSNIINQSQKLAAWLSIVKQLNKWIKSGVFFHLTVSYKNCCMLTSMESAVQSHGGLNQACRTYFLWKACEQGHTPSSSLLRNSSKHTAQVCWEWKMTSLEIGSELIWLSYYQKLQLCNPMLKYYTCKCSWVHRNNLINLIYNNTAYILMSAIPSFCI